MNPAPVTLELPAGVARLVPLEDRHADELVAAARADPSVFRWWALPPPTELENLRAEMRLRLDAQSRGETVAFAITLREGGRAIGMTNYLAVQPANRALEIGGTWIGKPWQRTRVNTECKYLLLRHAFETLGCVRVCFMVDDRNTESKSAVLRIGARQEGVLRKVKIIHTGFIRDSAVFSVIAEEWPAVKQGLAQMLGPSTPGT